MPAHDLVKILATCLLLTSTAQAQGGCRYAPDPQTSKRAIAEPPVPGPQRRALLVGIDDYESQVPGPGQLPAPGRGFRNLHGAAGDARSLGEFLIARNGFRREDVIVLTDRAATRAAILQAFEKHLVAPAEPGDTMVFYFGGHGSRAVNPRSDELDKVDETLVPADAGRGARDIHDKDLRRLLNRLIDRGAVPTVILDSCHSGSGARGLPSGAQPRALRPDPLDSPDPGPYGPDPVERGALVLSAARADEFAWETVDAENTPHGAFTWALLRSLRDALPGEPAEETFLRVRARMQAEPRRQEPVLEAAAAARRAPFFGAAADSASRRAVVAVESIDRDGTVILQAGWAHGLALGSRVTWRPETGSVEELEVVQMLGLGRARAARTESRESADRPLRKALPPIPAGSLLEVTGWAAPLGRALPVWIPTWPAEVSTLQDLARRLAEAAAARGIEWVVDPIRDPPSHVLRWSGAEWRLMAPEGPSVGLGGAPDLAGVLERLPKGARFFLQLPLPEAAARGFEIGPGTPNDGIEPTRSPDTATVVLTGRFAEGRLEYAWLRPDSAEGGPLGLPVATPWRSAEALEPGKTGNHPLRDDLYHLRKVHGWLVLESPPHADFGYELVLEAEGDRSTPESGATLRGGELYHLVLRARQGFDPNFVKPRHLYVFTIDAQGSSVLLFGLRSDDNPQPFGLSAGKPAPMTVRLGSVPLVRVVPPFGRDHYFLLTSDWPLGNPWVLEYPGFRPRGPRGSSTLEELLSLTGGTSRGNERVVTPVDWSIARRSFVSEEKR